MSWRRGDSNVIAGSGEPTVAIVEVAGHRLTTATWGHGPVDVVLLHDGLGSIGQWRSLPGALAERTARTVLAYDRAGHADSTPRPIGPWPADWLHREATVLGALLDTVGAVRPALVGHSDGGSIAAIHAAAQPDACGALALLAAHSWVEPMTVEEIARLREDPGPVVERLGRFHPRADLLFEAWSGVWVSESFARWDIRPRLHAITAPTLVLQGTHDEYAPADHASETSASVGDNSRCHLLPGVGHLLHREAPELVLDLLTTFLEGEG